MVVVVVVVVISLRRLHQTVNLLLRLRAILQTQVIVDIKVTHRLMVKAHLLRHFWHQPIVILATFATLVTLQVLSTATKTPRLHRLIKM